MPVEVYVVISQPLANIEHVPEQLDGPEREETIRGHRSFEISRSLRRLRGTSVWSSAIVLLRQSRSPRSLNLTQTYPRFSAEFGKSREGAGRERISIRECPRDRTSREIRSIHHRAGRRRSEKKSDRSIFISQPWRYLPRSIIRACSTLARRDPDERNSI